MVAIYKLIEGLQHEMPRPLRITQLIYINADAIDISFRNDEKRFVWKALIIYATRLSKKRIDKVHLMVPVRDYTARQIALVYFNNKEAEEYASYINFYRNKIFLKLILNTLSWKNYRVCMD